jgi:hypothetical protein
MAERRQAFDGRTDRLLVMKKNGQPHAALMRETPEQRRLRLARLREQVSNGTYRPDLTAVAERLVAELRLGAHSN